MNIVFFDIETTGTDVAKDRIIDFAAVKYIDYGFPHETVTQFVKLINPETPIVNSDIHGITDDMVKDAPTFRSIGEDIKEFITGCVLSGFNIKRFDIPLLVEEFGRAGIEINIDPYFVIDTFLLYKNLFPQSLAAAHKKYTGEDITEAHRAINDTIACERVLRGMLNHEHVPSDINHLLKFQNGGENFDPTVDYAGKFIRTKDGDIVFNFGKYKGYKVDLNNDTISFLEWMLTKDFTQNTKMFANRFISDYYSDDNPF